jgi:hypothetical protein
MKARKCLKKVLLGKLKGRDQFEYLYKNKRVILEA